jgi:uncharacterized membrane protein YgdD (TMEM256/DUF423 family)
MHKKFILIAAILGATAVALGAFAAHGLKQKLLPEQLQVFETAVRYHFYHVLALLATGMLYVHYKAQQLIWAGRLFIAGIILFSGSLYLLTALPAAKWLGAVTPFGGACFIAAWLCIAVACFKNR